VRLTRRIVPSSSSPTKHAFPLSRAAGNIFGAFVLKNFAENRASISEQGSDVSFDKDERKGYSGRCSRLSSRFAATAYRASGGTKRNVVPAKPGVTLDGFDRLPRPPRQPGGAESGRSLRIAARSRRLRLARPGLKNILFFSFPRSLLDLRSYFFAGKHLRGLADPEIL